MDSRLECLLEEKYNLVKETTVLVLGIGGVGSYVVESLVRTGFKKIIIADFDVIDISNLNRQIMTTKNNVGLLKTDVWEDRIKSINPNCEVVKINSFINVDNLNELFTDNVDYVVDACDTLETKKEIILYCLKNNIKFISSMGMANRVDSSKIKQTYLHKTFNDPLAKKLRSMLRTVNKKIPVIFSEEVPKKGKKLGSIAHVVGTSGFLIVNYIINDIIGDYEKIS